ncbi:MAG: sigma-70 family RNA polymerase sigma factor, partial [Lawsonibacter sp.]|nr:sigma-70 family RNA polymerase sigma factor [Lawsonibacter sp.]
LQKYGPLLRYIITPILDDQREREECISDVTLLVWDKIGSYVPEKGAFPTWLSALARNMALNRRRDHQRHQHIQEEPDGKMLDQGPGPEDCLLQKERAQRLQRVIDRLGNQERNLFYRKYYYLQSTAQMAAELGLSQRAVEGRLHRLRNRLRNELGGDLA